MLKKAPSTPESARCSRWKSRKVVLKKKSFFDTAPIELSPFSCLLRDHEARKKQKARLSECQPLKLDLVKYPHDTALEDKTNIELGGKLEDELVDDVVDNYKEAELQDDRTGDYIDEDYYDDDIVETGAVLDDNNEALTATYQTSDDRDVIEIQKVLDGLDIDSDGIFQATSDDESVKNEISDLDDQYIGGEDCPIIRSPILDLLSPAKKRSLTVQQKALGLCSQNTFLPIENFFTPLMKRSAKKLGEGVFGEVFSAYTDDGDALAIKIMPIDGKDKINDEKQKTFEEILPEMVITKELSDLGNDLNAKHYTKNFVQLNKMGICMGQYPDFLLEAWDQWDEEEESENDRPDMFHHDQLFILFAFQNSGHALESFVFHSQAEARSVVAQIAGTLAVGESAFGFEHRDMHRGNILVKRTRQPNMVFVLDSVKYSIPSEGVKVSVIDYTLSRIQQGECVSYNDLNNLPWLFEGKNGLQHQTYLHMRNLTHGEWSKFTPKSNAYWMHYIVNRMAIKSKVKNLTRRHIYSALRLYLSSFPEYDSAKQIFLDLFSKPPPSISSKKFM